MLVKKFETDSNIKISDKYFGAYFTEERFGTLETNEYGISVEGKIIPYARILYFEPIVFTENNKAKRSKKSLGELGSEPVSLPETTESY